MPPRAVFRVITSAIIVLAVGWTHAWAAKASTQRASTPLPRYKLSVGQELAYRTKNSKNTVTFYVTRSNPDGGWHVFEIYRYPSPRIKAPANGAALFNSQLKCEFDLTRDGTLGDKPVGPADDVVTFFPRLPPDAAAGEWEASRPQGQSIRFHRLPATRPSERDFGGNVEGATQRVLKARTTCRVRFDTAQGLPVRIEIEFEQPSGKQTRWAWDLGQNQVHPASWANRFGGEAAAVMRARSRYEHAMLNAGAVADDKQAMAGFAAALQGLKDARSQITVPALLEVMDGYIRNHPSFAGFIRGRHDAAHLERTRGNPT